MALWVAQEGGALIRRDADGDRRLCDNPLCLCACGDSVVCACPNGAYVYAQRDARELARYPLPPGAVRLCSLPGALYCLSGEADSVSLLCPATGRLRVCAQAGCYPRDMRLSPDGRALAVAGGAAGTLLTLDARELSLMQKTPLPGVVCALSFAGAAVYALCAAGESDIRACLYRVSPRGVIEEMLRLDGLPGALLALADGGVLAGVAGTLLRLRSDGRVAWRIPCGLPSNLRLYGGYALCADPLEGRVLRVPLHIARRAQVLYDQGAPCDMLLL